MKKFFALTLAVLMMLSMAACTPKEEADPTDGTTTAPTTTPPTTEPKAEAPESALKVLEDTWALYAEDEKFAVSGGADVMGAPGALDLETYAENLAYMLVIPQDQMVNIDEAATMVHMMNANTFTSGIVHLKDGVDQAAFAAAMRDALKNNMWLCGFPEKLVLADLGGGYTLIAFGNGEIVDTFTGKLATAYPDVNTLYNEEI